MTYRFLIVYASRHGQTEAIAHYLLGELSRQFHSAIAVDAERLPKNLDVLDYDAVIVGAPVLRGKHLAAAKRFVTNYRAKLDRVATGFYSVSLAMATPSHDGRFRASTYVERFTRATSWKPGLTARFAGALAYRRYGLALRLLIRAIARYRRLSTDTSKDHEFTNWSRVDEFLTDMISVLEKDRRADRLDTPA